MLSSNPNMGALIKTSLFCAWIYLFLNSYSKGQRLHFCDVTTCNKVRVDNVVVETYDNFVVAENDKLVREVERLRKKLAKLKGKYTMKDV